MDKHQLLKKYYGHDSFRKGQEELIDALCSGRDVLGIMPTGAGKSVCYQIPALLFEGITLVVSPLISLMKDQVGALVQNGIRAAYINSSLSASQQHEAMSRAANGEYKIIYVAPERLMTEGFLAFAKSARISLLAVDEAHCVSQWGQDFRPHYLEIYKFLAQLPARPALCAFTATATKGVREDIIRLIGLRDPFTVVTGFDRPNLYFEVQRPSGGKDDALIKAVERNRGKSGIIYCSTRNNVENVCEMLCQKGYPATRYHAGLSAEERRRNQEDFIFDRKSIMVATNAFGMGIDKSNVSYVLHYNMPKSIEAYYQEAGRAGRDGEPAECILFYSGQDVRTNLFLIEKSENEGVDPETAQKIKEKDKERLRDMTYYCTSDDCLRRRILRYFGEYTAHNCDNCGNCNTYYETVDVTTEAQMIVSCVWRMSSHAKGADFGISATVDVLRGVHSMTVEKFGFESLSTFGIMRDQPAHRIIAVMQMLISEGYLQQTDSLKPTITICERSREIVHDKKPVSMRLPTKKKEQRKTAPAEKKPVKRGKSMLDALRDVRTAIASKVHMPAYIIFSNASLQDMCRKLPTTLEQFKDISGVGERKAEKYWDMFKPVLIEYALIAQEQGIKPSSDK